MNKGTKIALIALAVLSLVCLVGVWSMFTNAKGVLEKAKAEAVTEGNTILVLLASAWIYEDIELRTANDWDVTQRKLDDWHGQYGTLRSGDMKLEAFEVTSDKLIATLDGVAEFEKGKGQVTMVLTREPGNSWLLSHMDVKPSP